MKISCIIPTYNRATNLDLLLISIGTQTIKSDEIIIIDNSDESYSGVFDLIKNKYPSKNIHYFRNSTGNSITRAKNYGVKKSKGDIILFFDDDLILKKNYIEQILNTYKEYPNAVGVQGYIKPKGKPIYYRFTKKMKVTSWGFNTYPLDLKKTIPCEWMSGGNSSYKKEVFKLLEFDGKLNKYCFKEDVDFSYRVFKKYKGNLFITPKALALHNHATDGRLTNKELIYMKTKNMCYFFFKNMKQTKKAQLLFIFWEMGFSLLMFSRALSQKNLKLIKYVFESYIFALKNINKLKKGDLNF